MLISNFDKLQHATALLATVVVCVLGFLVTLGIFIYDRRSEVSYNELISRGRKIEGEPGVHTAIFQGRVDKKSRFISHG